MSSSSYLEWAHKYRKTSTRCCYHIGELAHPSIQQSLSQRSTKSILGHKRGVCHKRKQYRPRNQTKANQPTIRNRNHLTALRIPYMQSTLVHVHVRPPGPSHNPQSLVCPIGHRMTPLFLKTELGTGYFVQLNSIAVAKTQLCIQIQKFLMQVKCSHTSNQTWKNALAEN